MEHAKKLLLVEPHLLEQLQVNNEYKEIQKPADKKAKTSVSLQMQKMLNEDGDADDIKVKKYQQALSKFLSLKSAIPPSEQVKVNWLTQPEPTRRRSRRKSGWVPY
jgi:hypothetical protein